MFKILLAEWNQDWQDLIIKEITKVLKEVGCQDQDYSIKIFDNFFDANDALNQSRWNLLITDLACLSGGDITDDTQKKLVGRQLITIAHQKQTPTIAISGSVYVKIHHTVDLMQQQCFVFEKELEKKTFDKNKFRDILKQIWQLQNSAIYYIFIPNQNSVNVKKWIPGQQTANESSGIFDNDKLIREVKPLLESYGSLINNSNNIIKLGDTLFDALFDNGLRQDFLGYYQEIVEQNHQKLNIVLEINESAMPEVVALPWEFMRIPQKYHQGNIFFATDSHLTFSRSRYNSLKEKPQYAQLEKEEKLKIALVVARPARRTSQTDPDLSNVEFNQIENHLNQLAHKQERIELLPVINPATPQKVSSVIGSDQPDIFHFIGHGRLQRENGKEVGQVAFVKDSGEPDWKNADFFSILLDQHRPKLVILQACNTGKESDLNPFNSVASHLMLQGISIVIAMQYEVSNNTANMFIEDLYSEIAKGESVDVAVQQARFNIALTKEYDKPDFATPVIYMNALNARFE